MAKKPPNSEADRLDAVEARVDGLTARMEQIEASDRQVRAELAQHGVVTPVIMPARRKAKLSPQQRKAIRQQTARAARAAKQVGSGQGAVRSASTKKKLAAEAKGRTK